MKLIASSAGIQPLWAVLYPWCSLRRQVQSRIVPECRCCV